MELLLNEKSLDGQFKELEDFYQVLPDMSRNLKILRQKQVSLLKHSALYSRKITQDMTILDLQNRKGNVSPLHRDKVKKWKRELSSLIMEPPFWDMESSEQIDSLQEAARRQTDVLSFPHPDYQDRILLISYKDIAVPVKSAVTTKYLLELLFQHKTLDVLEFLKLRYTEGRLRMDFLDMGIKNISALQKAEIEELLIALERFEAEPWSELQKDNFFCFKSYQPSSKKKNYFLNTDFEEKKLTNFGVESIQRSDASDLEKKNTFIY